MKKYVLLHFSDGNKEYPSDITSPCIYFCFFYLGKELNSYLKTEGKTKGFLERFSAIHRKR